MNHPIGQVMGDRGLVALIYELIDAHRDTVELRLERAGELRWEAHLDYLQALHRRTREILAHSQHLLESASEADGPR